MNDPRKALNVNFSSLLSLKAELQRKQVEVNKKKATRSVAEEEYDTKTTETSSLADPDRPKTSKNKKHRTAEVSKNDKAKIHEHEDSALLEKSQRVLQAKSKFYDRMSRTGGKLNSDDNCLVLFNRKLQDEKPEMHSDERRISESDSSDSSEGTYESDDEWVEYIDCLGRTRKCLQKDLEYVKRRDAELAASMPERLDQSKANWMMGARNDNDGDTPIGPLPPPSIFSDGCSMVSKLEEQRINWERKERENFDKVDVHYQDVFFDEARQHGVGYYAFSTDEEERKRQQKRMDDARLQTLEEQEKRTAMRAKREKILAMRVIAAKNRQRARIGEAPLDEAEELKKIEEAKSKETKAERKIRKREEKLQKQREAAEKEREIERQHHTREWDVGKGLNDLVQGEGKETPEDSTWTYKPERLPLSQEEWNEQKRAERKPEFAPLLEEARSQRTNFTSMPPPAAPVDDFESRPVYDNFANFQSSKREKQFHRRNYEAATSTEQSNDVQPRGAEIAPPTDLDAAYNLPPHAKKSRSNIELERSIEAGLRFLRENCDKNAKATKDSWTAKADY